jgi:hypothetical protein
VRTRLTEKEWMDTRDRIIKEKKQPKDFVKIINKKDNFDLVESDIQKIQQKLDDLKQTINTIRMQVKMFF